MSSAPSSTSPLTTKLARTVKRLAQRRDNAPFDLAASLFELKQSDAKAFGRLVDELDRSSKKASVRGLSRRRLLYLTELAETLPLDRWGDRLRRIGWTKATIIAAAVRRGMPTSDLDHLLDLAETDTVPDLRRVLNDQQVVDGMRTVLLRFGPEEYERLAQALKAFGAAEAGSRGLAGMEDALLQLVDKAMSKP